MLELHPDAPYFHIGGDEAALSTACPRCRGARRDTSEILIEHFLETAGWLLQQGTQPVLWCDMPLRHPAALDRLAGQVTMMDWDYWSGTRPGHPAQVWLPFGSQARSEAPATWPAQHRELFFETVFEADGRTARPFPYTAFLVKRGFDVIVASAARCFGDSFCAPAPRHVDNVIGAARAAARHGAQGCVVTSWAIRRAPWPTTEHALIAGGLAMNNPRISRRRVDTAFAHEHFGRSDASLAGIPRILGGSVDYLTDSLPHYDRASGQWWGMRPDLRWDGLTRMGVSVIPRLRRLRAAAGRATRRIDAIAPRTSRTKRNAALWRWVRDLTAFQADLALAALDAPPIASAERQRLRQECSRLERRTRQLLGRWLTPPSMAAEIQTRFALARFLLSQ